MQLFRPIVRWYKALKIALNLASTAKKTLASNEAEAGALMKALVIQAALRERKPICFHCLNPFEFKERSQGEWSQLRSILLIPDAAPNPMLCDPCAHAAVARFNRMATTIGTSNVHGGDNLVLRHLRAVS